MSSEAKNVTVKLKRGAWEIEITCSEDKVQQAVESVIAGMASKENLVISEEAPTEGAEGEGRFATCHSLLLAFWREGWFATPRLLKDVHEEMGRRGYHFDRTAVSHSLVDLVKEDTLSREGAQRTYRYVQKHPPPKGQGGTATA